LNGGLYEEKNADSPRGKPKPGRSTYYTRHKRNERLLLKRNSGISVSGTVVKTDRRHRVSEMWGQKSCVSQATGKRSPRGTEDGTYKKFPRNAPCQRSNGGGGKEAGITEKGKGGSSTSRGAELGGRKCLGQERKKEFESRTLSPGGGGKG